MIPRYLSAMLSKHPGAIVTGEEHIQVLSTRVMDASFAGRSDDPAVPVQSYWYFDTGEWRNLGVINPGDRC